MILFCRYLVTRNKDDEASDIDEDDPHDGTYWKYREYEEGKFQFIRHSFLIKGLKIKSCSEGSSRCYRIC